MLDTVVLKRTEGLEVHESRDGLIIYAVATDEVHYLNPSAALIYELCDGRRTLGETAALVGETFGLPSPPFEDVRIAATDLVARNVLHI